MHGRHSSYSHEWRQPMSQRLAALWWHCCDVSHQCQWPSTCYGLELAFSFARILDTLVWHKILLSLKNVRIQKCKAITSWSPGLQKKKKKKIPAGNSTGVKKILQETNSNWDVKEDKNKGSNMMENIEDWSSHSISQNRTKPRKMAR